jgi:RNA polymerase sigma-54 factor
MALELRQQLKLTQQLVMTPQLQQAIKLLQLSRMELVEAIHQELETNPVLEETTVEEQLSTPDNGTSSAKAEELQLPSLSVSDDEKIPWEKKAIEEINWKDILQEERKVAIQSYSFETKEAPDYENFVSKSEGLSEHLMWQLQLSDFTEKGREIGTLIIGNLNSDGYLTASLEEISSEAKVSLDQAEHVLTRIQNFDPVGIAARDLKECLLIQFENLQIKDELVKILISDHLHDLELHNYQKIAKTTSRSMNEIAIAIEVILGLDPRPGSNFSSETPQYIVPDIYVFKIDDDYVVSMNDDGMPQLKISGYYKQALEKGFSQDDAKTFIQDKLKSAMWLMRCIQQRQKTIYKVTKSIVKFQRDFLEKGIESLKPMILKDVAEDVDLHESTVSRVTTNKYVQTPQGLFELKFFFSSALSRKNGPDVASQAVKEKIRLFIQSEDPEKPYNDSQIVDYLKKQNIKIARRTVAKYRELMGILPKNRRKRPDINK